MLSVVADWIENYRLLVTVGVVAIVWAARAISIGSVRRQHVFLNEDQRQLIGRVKALSGVLIAVSIIALWLPQIQNLALSITAVALAVVIATKELILCLSGTLLRQLSSPFRIGDWIQVQDRFGEVIEESLLTTSLLEIDFENYSYTGRTLTLPNSHFLSSTIVNQNILKRYVFHRFRFTAEPSAAALDIQQAFERELEFICGEYEDTAKRYNALLERRSGIDIPNADPVVRIDSNDFANVVVTATLFLPTAEFESISRKVTKAFYTVLDQSRARKA